MTLEAGTTLGTYEILSSIGAGGMGEVYRSRDTKLDREVAIKVLPEYFARDAERVARFEREAKVLASLNHANIGAIYGVEESEGQRFLILELIEGETLAERLSAGGPIPVPEALRIARHIAEALETAHENGVIHRDLKPANIKLTPDGRVKVLDFGLAKAFSTEGSQTQLATSPTITADFTREGVVLGTAAYMSPEQARGKPLDKRTDIWSFGCVLYECLTGTRPFDGETTSDMIARILEREPDWGLLPGDTPAVVQLLLRRCLAKDVSRRLRDIGDARVEIEEAIADPSATSLSLAGAALAAASVRRRASALQRWSPAVAALLLVALGVALAGLWRATRPVATTPIRLNVEVADEGELQLFAGAQFDISADGETLVYRGETGPDSRLYVRRLEQVESTALSGTEGAQHPFFSPDGQWVGFFADRKLKKVSVAGGAPLGLWEAPYDRGGTWGADGNIVFTPTTTSGLMRVPAAGGTAENLTEPDKGANERSHRWPQVLPGGRGVLFTGQDRNTDFNAANIELLVLESGERKVLHRGGSFARYSPSGHIVYIREGTLFAVPFDLDKLEVTGTAAPVLEGILSDSRNGGAQYAVSDAGTLIYRPGSQMQETTSLVWMDLEGQETPLFGELRNYTRPECSPDGKRIAVGVYSPTETDVWVLDIERGTLVRLTFDAGTDAAPVWSRDGQSIIFSSDRDGTAMNLYRKPADGSGQAERLTTSESDQYPYSVSADGKTLLVTTRNDDTSWDIVTLNLEEGGEVEAFLQTPFNEGSATFSPDGKWVVYGSNESGKWEIYVRPFPATGGKWQVSTGGGASARWSPDGKELYYRDDDKLMAVAVTAEGGSFSADRPRILFEASSGGPGGLIPYDVVPGGTRFVWLKDHMPDQGERTHLRFVFNWFDEIRSKVPTGTR